MRKRLALVVLAAAVLLAPVASQVSAQVQSPVFDALQWRLVGPFRGGRSLACAGSKARPNEYYFGATGGGLWKSTDSGDNWECVSDGFFTAASVGAVAIAESNPDIVYAGGGEKDIRGNISHGDGMYKTTDGGKTWTHIGLRDTQTISRIVIHPANPDVVYVAALGHIYGPNKERGVFKTTDGGKSWNQILFESERAGAIDIEFEPGNPETLYAATWEAWRTPYTMNSGGPGCKLWKSTNGGATWKDISRNPGLPAGVLGKIGISVSPVNPKRVWAIVEALEGGVFLSDDAGETFTLVNQNRNFRQRAWYYTHIVADTADVDTAYVLNVSMYRTRDGGKTWQTVGTPHADNHDLWIAPDDPKRMINANDGGANVSKDSGATWTEQDIPTAQFYHVTTDNAFPYRIYGAQQDNSTIRIASRTTGGLIGPDAWTGTAGGESGYIAVKPDDPEIVFGGSYGGLLEMLNHRNGESRNVNPWPDNPMGHGAADLVHRMQWTFPIVFSPHNANKLYTCSQHVMVSTNMGETWKKISPDLTRNDKRTMGPSGGPITKDNTSVEYYGTVFAFAESPKVPGVLWAGSDDGLVHVSVDGGASWKNVTPKGMPEWGLVSSVEASPHDAGTAYIAVDNHENDDHAPYVYRTFDFGQNWERVVEGIAPNAFLRVVREDPVRRGLLFAGTELGIFVSFDSGDHWQSMQRNLPVSPIHDIAIKNADVIVATHGRSFWVLDEIGPMRNLYSGDSGRVKLFPIPDATRNFFGGGGFGGRGGRPRGGPAPVGGQNPPSGLLATYVLPKDAQKVQFEVFDPWGEKVHTQEGPKTAGAHRIAMSFRYPSFQGFPGMILWAAGARPIPAPPGEYRVVMTADGDVQVETFCLRNSPNSSATEADTVAQFLFARRISQRTNDANGAVVKIRAIKRSIASAIEKHGDLKAKGEDLAAKLSAIEEEIYQVRNQSGQDPLNYPIRLNNKIAALLGVVLQGDFRPTDQAYEVFAMLDQQLAVQLAALDELLAHAGAEFNAELKSRGLPPLGDNAGNVGG